MSRLRVDHVRALLPALDELRPCDVMHHRHAVGQVERIVRVGDSIALGHDDRNLCPPPLQLGQHLRKGIERHDRQAQIMQPLREQARTRSHIERRVAAGLPQQIAGAAGQVGLLDVEGKDAIIDGGDGVETDGGFKRADRAGHGVCVRR